MNKKINLILFLAILLVVAFTLSACKPVEAQWEIVSVTLDTESADLYTDQTWQLGSIVMAKTQYTESAKTDKFPVKYVSSNESVLTVDDKGNVTPKGIGTAIVTATATTEDQLSTKSDTCTFNIKGRPLESINLGKNFDMAIGSTVQLQPVFSPATATDKTLTYTSDNEYVATVDNQGNVTAHRSGVITITASQGNIKSSVTITCKIVAVTGISLDRTAFGLAKGSTTSITVLLSPANATNKNVSFTSSNNDVATVDANGVVKGIAEGRVTITVKTADGNFTAQCSVEVIKPKATAMEISVPTGTLMIGQAETITVTTTPTDAIDTFIFSSSKPSVATVNQNGVISALSSGETVITVSTADNRLSKTQTIRVTEIGPGGITLTKLDGTSLTQIDLAVGSGYTLTGNTPSTPVWQTILYYVTPSTTTAKNVTVSSDNSGVFTATVNDNLILIKATGRGKAKLTVTSEINTVYTTIDVVVGYKMSSSETLADVLTRINTGETIYLYNKTYTETVTLSRDVTLVGGKDSDGKLLSTLNGQIIVRPNTKINLNDLNLTSASKDIVTMVDTNSTSNISDLISITLKMRGCQLTMNHSYACVNIDGNVQNDNGQGSSISVSVSSCSFKLNSASSVAVNINGLDSSCSIAVTDSSVNGDGTSNNTTGVKIKSCYGTTLNLTDCSLTELYTALNVQEKTANLHVIVNSSTLQGYKTLTLYGGKNHTTASYQTASLNTYAITDSVLIGRNTLDIGTVNVYDNDGAVVSLYGNDTLTLTNCQIVAKTKPLSYSPYPAYEYLFDFSGTNNIVRCVNCTLTPITNYTRSDHENAYFTNGMKYNEGNYIYVKQDDTNTSCTAVMPVLSLTNGSTFDLSVNAKKIFGSTETIYYALATGSSSTVATVSNAGVISSQSVGTVTVDINLGTYKPNYRYSITVNVVANSGS